MELTLDQALVKGVEAHKAGKLEEADRYYTAILKAQPKHPDANHNMGVLAVGVGKIEIALPFFKNALEANANIAQFWLSYIDALIKLNRIADAKAVFDEAKSKGLKDDGFDKLEEQLGSSHPKNINIQDPPQDQLNSLIKLYDKKEFQQVFEETQTLVKRYNKSLAIWNLMGASAAKIEKLDEAVNAFQNTISIKPDLAEVYFNMGIVLINQGKLDEAIEAYNNALSLKPDYAEAHNNMGIALKDQGKLEEAIEAYKKALSIKPNFVEAYYNIGIALQDQGKLEEAIEVYKKALLINPEYAQAYNNMGNTLKDQGKLEEAIKAFNKALSLKPDYAEAYNNIGIALQDQGKLEEAIEAYNKALLIKPDYASAIFHLGKSLKQLGQTDESIKYFEQNLSLDPQDTLGAELELVLLGQKNIPSKTPQTYMLDFYKKRSNRWNKDSNNKNGKYNGHVLIKNAFSSLMRAPDKMDVLDLGCGTGSLASYLRPFSKKLDGVDLSLDMIKFAKAKGFYDALYQRDIETYLEEISDQYDVIVAAAVLIHFFDLEKVLSLIWNSLKENGSLIFSVFEGSKIDKELNEFLMYSHSKDYINGLANSLGFKVNYLKTAIHEYHRGKPINALIYVLQK